MKVTEKKARQRWQREVDENRLILMMWQKTRKWKFIKVKKARKIAVTMFWVEITQTEK